jgi:hypothetical protein
LTTDPRRSDNYEQLARTAATDPARPASLPRGPPLPRPAPAPPAARRYRLPAARLAGLRARLGPGLSTNAILLATCACALAPHRRPPEPPEADAVIVDVIIDRRGRCWDADRFGNGVASAPVVLPWHLLLAGDDAAAAAASAASAQLRTGIAALRTDPAAAAASAAAARAAARAPPLFVWNSWAAAGRSFRRASFGCPGGPGRVEWLNAFAHRSPGIVLVLPDAAQPPPPPGERAGQGDPAAGEGLAAAAAAAAAEGAGEGRDRDVEVGASCIDLTAVRARPEALAVDSSSCLPVTLSLCLSVSLSPSLRLRLYVSVILSLYVSVCLSVSVSLYQSL